MRNSILLEGNIKFGDTYEEFCESIKTWDYLSCTNDGIRPTIKITLTNIQLETLKQCGHFTVLNRREKVEIALADKEETPKKFVKNKENL